MVSLAFLKRRRSARGRPRVYCERAPETVTAIDGKASLPSTAALKYPKALPGIPYSREYGLYKSPGPVSIGFVFLVFQGWKFAATTSLTDSLRTDNLCTD